jgi:hypothetical protein
LNVPIRRVVFEVSGQSRVAVIGIRLIDKALTIASLMTAARPLMAVAVLACDPRSCAGRGTNEGVL